MIEVSMAYTATRIDDQVVVKGYTLPKVEVKINNVNRMIQRLRQTD